MINLFLFLSLIFVACSDPTAEAPAAEIGKAGAIASQPVPVSNPAPEPTTANIGRRTAAEMVAAGFKRYGVEKGAIIFRMDGSMTGTEHLYFDHWGWREGKYLNTQVDIGAYDKKENKVQYLDGERRYDYNPATNEAHFFESRQVQRSADQYGTKDMTVVGDEMLKKMGGVMTGKGEVKGLQCDIWEIEKYNTKLLMWKGITLGERTDSRKTPVARTCILLDTTSVVPLEKMVLPEGAKLIGL